MALRICLVSPPYSGHLHPLLAIGRALTDLAEVAVISTPSAAAAVQAAGLQFRPILPDAEPVITAIADPGHAVKSNPLRLLRQLRANVSLQPELLAALTAAFEAIQPALVIADFCLPVAGPAAVKSGARWWTSLPSPCVFETDDGPPAYFGGLYPAESWGEKLREAVLRHATRAFKRAMFFLFRRTFRQVSLPSVYRDDGSERVYSPDRILACGLGEMEFATTYPPHFHFIGPALYTPSNPHLPGPVFEPGRKHILITLGTHQAHLKDEIARQAAVAASQHPECVFHFSDGDSSRSPLSSPIGNFQRYPFISYYQHLSRYDLVLHHAGAGIMLHCLSHGIPSVVLPLDFDQFDYAARLDHAGLALRIRSPQEISAAIAAALNDSSLTARCRSFAKQVVSRYDASEIVRTWIADL